MAFTSTFQCLAIVLAFVSCAVVAQPKDFLRKVSTREVVNDLEASLSDLLSGHASAAATQKLAGIEAAIWQTFQSLPKNSAGRLAPPAVRYIVHAYFAKEHGWQIKGLEPQGMQQNASKVHDVFILQDKAPLLVEGLLEARQNDRGLALADIVAMVAVLEQIVFDESVALLEAAYRFNGLSVDSPIDEAMLHIVLKSYLVLFGQGMKADLNDAAKHHQILARPREDIEDFESNAVLNYQFARRHRTNPFVARQYSFEAVAEIVADLAQRYGKWQNAECRDMKAHMVELDPEGLGRVPLGLLYAQPAGASYHFSESAEYLRKIGALDETSANPQVYISNYILGPSNCIASSSYYSVCCLSDCDLIMSEIEQKVLAPAASPERLLGLVRNLSDHALPRGLPQKLQSIAEHHGGEVPVHGRLFAQWLHFAFPHECPYPSILESVNALSTSHWHSVTYSAGAEERTNQMLSTNTTAPVGQLNVEERWSDHEVLLLYDQPVAGAGLASFMRVAIQLLALCLGLRSIFSAWRAAAGARDGAEKKEKKDDDFVQSLHV